MKPGTRGARAQPPQSLLHQDAIVAVERHDVRDRAERDQVQEIRDRRLAPAARAASSARVTDAIR